METGETLLGDFLGSHTQGDILENLGFGLGEIHFFFYFLRRSKEHLHHSLADKTLAIYAEAYRLLDFRQRTLLQEHAEHTAAGDEHTHEIGTQVFAEQQPSCIGKALVENEQFGGIIDIEKRVIEYHHRIFVFTQGKHQLCLVFHILGFQSFHFLYHVYQSGTRDILLICQ